VAETEVKVSFDGVPSIPIEFVVDGLGQCTIDTVDQAATYFDTETLALTRAGASLRFRSDDGWTVKLPGHQARGALVRDEHTIAGAEGAPPRGAVDLVRAWIRSDPLVPIAYLHTTRRRAVVADAEGDIIEVVVDDVTGRVAASGESIRFVESEVESERDNVDDVVDTVVERLEAMGGDPGSPLPKVARVLGARALNPADVVAPGRAPRRASFEDVVRRSIATGTSRLMQFDAVVRLDVDREGVHQARTTVRRLRADLRTFRPWLDRAWCDELRNELRWLGTELGHVRDADVMLASLTAHAKTLPEPDRSNAGVLIDRLGQMRRRDYDALLEAMNSDRYIALLDRLVDATRAPRTRPRLRRDKRRGAAMRVAHSHARDIRKEVRHLAPNPPDGELHELRKQAKKARYALEAITPILGKRAKRAAHALENIQDTLGLHHDGVVAIAWLSAAARDSETQDVAFVAGRLAARYELDTIQPRRAWRKETKRARRLLARVG
jgi:CHAD domain-containing protein